MNIIPTKIQGAYIIEPKVFGDERGYFFESYSQRDFDAQVSSLIADNHHIEFVQDNESKSVYGVVRGLHFQKPPFAQSKLVRCVLGKVYDVAVDIRKGSKTYGQWVGVEISQDNHRQFFLPKGMAHGFAVLSKEAVFQYKCDEFYHVESEGAIAYNDSTLNIDWMLPKENIILSEKDKHHTDFSNFISPF